MAEQVEKKTYTAEEIKVLAPRYKGKPENFDPSRKGKTQRQPPKQQKLHAPKTNMPPPPTHLQQKETPQKNESLISEAIFGIDVTVTEIANYSKIVDRNI